MTAAHRFNPSHTPLTTVGPTEHAQRRDSQAHGFHAVGSVECPRCNKTFVGAAIVNDDTIQMDFANQRFFVVRRAFCDHCDHILIWEQLCNGAGTQLGEVLSERPGLLRSPRAIASFLRQHPEAAGVGQ